MEQRRSSVITGNDLSKAEENAEKREEVRGAFFLRSAADEILSSSSTPILPFLTH